MNVAFPRFAWLLICLLPALPAAAADLPAGGTVEFTLDRPAVTSAGVYDADGHLVRVLWTMEQTDAGKVSRPWDGKDASGKPAPEGKYTFKVVVNRATYANVGAIGNSGQPPDADHHTPAHMEAVAVDKDGSVYTANGWDEAGHDFKKWDKDGNCVYHANIQIRNGKPNGAPYSIAVDDDYLYCGVGGWASKPWNEAQQIQRFRKKDGKHEPFTGKNLKDGHIQVYEWPSKQIPEGTPGAEAEVLKLPLRSLAVHGGTIYCADALGNRVLKFDKVTGEPQGEIKVQRPTALAVDDSEVLWIGYDHKRVARYEADEKKLDQVVSNGKEIEAIAVWGDIGLGDLYVADSGAGQVRVYSWSKDLHGDDIPFGERAGRSDRAPDHFFHLRGLALDKDWSLITIQNEPYGGARIARWTNVGPVANPRLAWEHFGCEFVSLGSYGTNDRDLFYSMTFHRYVIKDRPNGGLLYAGVAAPFSERRFYGDVHGVPRVLKIGSDTFFFTPTGDGVQVYRIEKEKFMSLATLIGGRSPAPTGEKESKQPLGQWSWSDAKGTGEPKPDEIKWFREPGKGQYSCFGMDVDGKGNVVFANTQTHSVWGIPMGPADARANPTYDWAQAHEIVPKDATPLKFEPNMAQRADDGSVYAFGWSAAWPQPKNNPFWMGGTTLARFDAGGKLLWAVELPELCVGLDVIPGGAGGCMVGSGKKAAVLHYTADGLLVGRMEPGDAMRKQSGWLDNHASVAVNRDPRDGILDVFTEDDFVLRIGWYRVNDKDVQVLNGEVKR